MVLQANGPISLDDIKGEFGGSAPDSIEEYYRDGGLVTSNNINIPVCATGDCPINFQEFYSGELIYSKVISVTPSPSYIVLSDYFNEAEWTSIAPKEVVIDVGVQIGSIDINIPACRTGILVNGQAMAGTLKLIVNGYIYGAGGLAGISGGAGGKGGDALKAEIPITVQNNSRIYAGGGGGGGGGKGADTRYYPQNTLYKYFIDFSDFWSDSKIMWLATTANGSNSAIVSWYYKYTTDKSAPSTITEFVASGWRYQRGIFQTNNGNGATNYYSVRRCYEDTQIGTIGGVGGRGKGYNQSNSNGLSASYTVTAGIGGKGGNGGDWGASGLTGAGGASGTLGLVIVMLAATGSNSGNLSGYYIINNSNVTWETVGLVLGRVG